MKCSGNGQSDFLKILISMEKSLGIESDSVIPNQPSVVAFRPKFPFHILGRELVLLLYIKS